MNRFSAIQTMWNAYPCVVLKDMQLNSEVTITLHGATVVSMMIPFLDGNPFNIIDGYQHAGELKKQSGSRCCIMAPFSNRIQDSKYEWNGQIHEIQPVNPLYPKVRHGLVKDAEFNVQEIVDGNESVQVTLITQDIRPGRFPGYPFSVDVKVIFTFSHQKLSMEIVGINTGSESVPFGAGWHPYFRISPFNKIDHCILTLPAETLILNDNEDIPLEGKQAYSPIENHPDLDFRPKTDMSLNIIGQRRLDYCYTDFKKSDNGLIESRLLDPETGLEITVFQESGYVYAFSGDTIQHRPRQSIAIEPVQHMTNFFNRPELKKQVTLSPGKTSSYKFGVSYGFHSQR